MYLSDQQLMLLEQLTYLEDLDLGISLPAKTDNLGQYVDLIVKNEAVMKKLRADPGEFTSGEQWAAILQGIANDEDLRKLKPHDVNGSVYARSFTDPDDESKGIVIFKGTADAREWDDDVRGLNVADTPCQEEARNYIEGLPFKDITVVGHSKGGNKAQYVTVTSDKVSRCISMDGQGFSQEFMVKYFPEICEKGSRIKNYSLDADYVHILLFPVPGAEQIYIKSDINNRGMQNHSPANLLSYKFKDGKLVLNTDDNGPVLDIVPNELPAITYLRELTYFILHNASDEDKQELVDLIGPVLAVAMIEEGFEYEGVLYTKDNILDYVMSNPKGVATLLAYLTKYIEVYKLEGEQVQGILAAFGLIFDFAGSEEFLDFLSDALRFVLGNLGDQETDKVLEAALSLFNKFLREKFGKDYNLPEIWQQAEYIYENIDDSNQYSANHSTVIHRDKVRDFSSKTYDLLISTIDRIRKLTYNNVADLKAYSGEPWYDELFVNALVNGIDKYYQELEKINTSSQNKITTIFNNISDIDKDCSNKLFGIMDAIHKEIRKIDERF